jgi:hypothetical protein
MTSPVTVDLADAMGKAFAHGVKPGSLHWIQVLRLLLDLVPRCLGFRYPKLDQSVRELCHAVLIGGRPRLELPHHCISNGPLARRELPSLGIEIPAGDAEPGCLVTRKPQPFLDP